jgi:hypothetical protein
MASCDQIRELLSAFLDGELNDADALRVSDHLAECAECGDLKETLDLITDTIAPVHEISPPAHLASDIAASPCRRWLGLLFAAVDRDIGQQNLDRLVPHLESCSSCRQAWNDLTLIHQVSDAMIPPPGLLERCITVRLKPALRPILSRRAATAAAYVMAVVASLTIGNPVSIARSPVVQRVAETVTTEVTEVAAEGRGELRVMAWRVWQWGNRQVDAVRDMLLDSDEKPDSESEQGDRS